MMIQSDATEEIKMLITGPVIGCVTDSQARIVFETNCSQDITITLTSRRRHHSRHVVKVTQSVEAKRPVAASFQFLHPETYYKVTFDIDTPGLKKSGFRTLPKHWSLDHKTARFAFVSCNKYRITRDEVPLKFDLWRSLCKKIAHGDVDYVIHLGDNVYADSDLYDIEEGLKDDIKDCRWALALKLMEGKPQSEWHQYYDEICEICRTIYRQTWNHPPTRHALANVPNLMIMDDHDIRDDWGDRDEDRDPLSLSFFIACCFYEVYNEYQRNLFEDYHPGRNAFDCLRVGQCFHFHVFGDIGLMITEARSCKTFHKDFNNLEKENEMPLLGVKQWSDIKAALSKDGIFSDCRMLFAVCPQPPCYIAEGPNMLIAKLSRYFDDLYGSWGASCHVPEASLFLQSLFDWRAEKAGFREACIVAGDVHEGGYTDICDIRFMEKQDARLHQMKQITTSAIANSLVKSHEHLALSLARTIVNKVGETHTFEHYLWTGMRNFNIITCFVGKHADGQPQTRYRSRMFGASSWCAKSFPPVDSSDFSYKVIPFISTLPSNVQDDILGYSWVP